MAWYDDPSLYYCSPLATLTQGDIVIAAPHPLDRDERDACGRSRQPESDGRLVAPASSSYGAYAQSRPGRPRPPGLAMVLPHTCVLRTELAKLTAVLEAAGYSPPEAERLANADVSIDGLVALAPLRTYGEVAPDRHAGVQTGAEPGMFPVPQNAASGIPPAWVDLRRISTANLSPDEWAAMRLSSVTPLVQAHLGFALAKRWAQRGVSRLDALQRALGQQISEVAAVTTDELLRLEFTLEDGSRRAFDASDEPLPPPNPKVHRPGPSRN